MNRVLARIDRWILPPAPAARLGAVRLLVGLYACIYLAIRLPHSIALGRFHPAQFAPVGLVRLLVNRPLPAWLVATLAVAAAAAAVPFVLGWRFRVTGPLFAALLLWTRSYANSWGMCFHTDNLLVLYAIVLAAAPSADALSLDARRGPVPAGDRPGYGWPLRLMALILVASYLLAGLAKLRNAGFDWGDDLRNYIAMDNARKLLLGDSASPLAAPLARLETFFRVLGVATIALELGAPVVFLGRRAAALWTGAAIGFHVGVVASMWIVFPFQLTGVAYLPLFRAERLVAWIRRRRRGRGPPAG